MKKWEGGSLFLTLFSPIFLYGGRFSAESHSAVFKFGGLLRLLNINLSKQDKPIS